MNQTTEKEIGGTNYCDVAKLLKLNYTLGTIKLTIASFMLFLPMLRLCLVGFWLWRRGLLDLDPVRTFEKAAPAPSQPCL